MPNWCDCELAVKAKNKAGVAKLKEFKRWAAGNTEPLSFDAVIPYPTKFRDLDRKAEEAAAAGDTSAKGGYDQGGYQWCVSNWGTKWDADGTMLRETKDGKTLRYNFMSAWSPPTPVIHAMGKKFPELTFTLRYWEGGMGFQGRYVMEGGDNVEDWTGDYHG